MAKFGKEDLYIMLLGIC